MRYPRAFTIMLLLFFPSFQNPLVVLKIAKGNYFIPYHKTIGLSVFPIAEQNTVLGCVQFKKTFRLAPCN